MNKPLVIFVTMSQAFVLGIALANHDWLPAALFLVNSAIGFALTMYYWRDRP